MSAPPSPLPPPGARPDEDRGPEVNIVIWIGFAVSTLFVLGRLYTRGFISRNLGIDDGLIAFSTITNFVLVMITSIGCVGNGLGRHLEYVPPDRITTVLFYAAIIQPFGVACFSIPKLALAMLIVSIMGPEKKGKWFLYIICTFLFIVGLVSVLVLFLQCNPSSHFWNPMQPADCISPLVLEYTTIFVAAWSAFVDFVLVVFPMRIFWDLKVKKSKKISMSIIMAFGLVAMISAIVKTTVLDSNHDPDFTYAFPDLVIWTLVEVDLVLMAASIPILPRLVRRLRGRDEMQSSSYGAKPTNGYGIRTGYKSFGSSKDRSKVDNTSSIEADRSDHQGYEMGFTNSNAAIVKSVQMEQTWDRV